MIHIFKSTGCLKIKCAFTVKGLLWKIVVTVGFLEVKLSEVLLKIIVIIFLKTSRRIEIVVVKVLPT